MTVNDYTLGMRFMAKLKYSISEVRTWAQQIPLREWYSNQR